MKAKACGIQSITLHSKVNVKSTKYHFAWLEPQTSLIDVGSSNEGFVVYEVYKGLDC